MSARNNQHMRRRGNRSLTLPRLAQQVAQLRLGQTFNYPRGRFDPPRVVTNPRWPLVLDTTIIQDAAGTQTISNDSIRTAVRGQIGLPSTFEGFALYFQRADIWTTPTDVVTGQVTIAMRLCDFDESGAYSQWIEDQGTPARPGHVHSAWPRSQQVVARPATGFNIIQVDSPAQFIGILHLHLLISFTSGDVIPTVRRVLRGSLDPHPVLVT